MRDVLRPSGLALLAAVSGITSFVPFADARPRIGAWLERVDEVAPDRQQRLAARVAP